MLTGGLSREATVLCKWVERGLAYDLPLKRPPMEGYRAPA
jgi:hypothetical protein